MAIQKTMEMESKAGDEDAQWAVINRYVEQIAGERVQQTKAQTSAPESSLDYFLKQGRNMAEYVAELHAIKAAARQAELDRWAKIRRKNGIFQP
jgi:hypothetical protein